MQESDYNTYYVGKLFNGHTVENYDKPHMKGYTGSEFWLEPFTYQVRTLFLLLISCADEGTVLQR